MKNKFLDKPAVHLALIALLGFAAYSNTFDVPFHFDDKPNIVGNYSIRHLSNIPSLLAGKSHIFASRPLMHATFAVNYYFGGLDTAGYHTVNFALHLLNGFLLYLLVAMTGRHLGREREEVAAAATLSALVFVVHPVQTEAVTIVVNRSMLLAATFCFSGLMLFLKAVTSERRRGAYMAGLFVVSLLGMGSRENFSMFPLLLLVYDLFFVSRFRLKEAAGHWKAYLPVVLSLGYMAYLLLGSTYAKRAAIAGIPPSEYILTQLNVQWTYLRLLVFPINQNFDYDYPVAKGLLELPTALSAAGYLALWAGSAALARKRPMISFPVLWFLIALLPISFLVALTSHMLNDVIFEHRIYLPGAAAMVSASVLFTGTVKRIGASRAIAGRVLAAALLVVTVALAYAAHERNAVWKSDISLWEDTVKKSPHKARPHNDLGIAYKNAGLTEKAIEQGNIAITLDPSFATAYVNLGNSYSSIGMYDKAIEYLKIAVYFRPYYTEAYYNLGVTYHYKGMTDEAMANYRKAIEINPSYADAHLNLGIAYLDEGMTEDAREEFEAVLRLNPGDERALRNMDIIRQLQRKHGGE